MVLSAQPGSIERKTVDKVDLDSKSFETWMSNATAYAAQIPWDPRAQSLLAMAESATSSIFRLDSRRLRKKAAKTKIEQIGDMMMLHWDVTVDSLKGELILHDTWYLSSYALKLRGPLTADEMAEILPRILSFHFQMQTSLAGTRFLTPVGPKQFDVPNSSQAVRTPAGDWIVVVHRGKSMLRDAYPDDTGIERFPPFGERIRMWNLQKLTGALRRLHPMDLDPMNEILLREIARRNPTDGLWKEVLLQEASPAGGVWIAENLWRRFSQILNSLRWHDPTNERAEAFRVAIRETVLALGDDSKMMMRDLNSRHCTPSHDAVFIAQLDDAASRGAAIEYLGECSMLPEMYDRIQAMSLPAELEEVRLRALDRFRGRQPHELSR